MKQRAIGGLAIRDPRRQEAAMTTGGPRGWAVRTLQPQGGAP